MKPSLQKITHVAVVVFGLLLAFGLLHWQSVLSAASADKAASARAGRPDRPQAHGGPADGKAVMNARHSAPKNFRASEYRKAWDAIAEQSLPQQKRFFLQMELLRHWAEVDLEGALAAAFDTSWDGRNNGMGIETLLQAFDKEFARRPTESWDLITSGRFGLGATLAKGRWARSVVKENPMLVANSLRQIPYHTRRSIFPEVLAAIKEDPSKIGSFYDKLAELPQDHLYLDMVRQSIEALGARGSLDEIRGKFMEATSDAQRTILIHELGKTLAGSSLDTITAELGKVPETDRGRILRSVTMHTETGGEQTPQLIGMLLQSGEYKEVQQRAQEHIKAYASTPEKQATLAAWAVNLPRMPDAAAVIHRSVAGYVMNDPQGSRAWLESIPASSWGRNTALAEYSQQMLWKHNDPEASAWALSQIADPKLKETATGWRGAWERKNAKQ